MWTINDFSTYRMLSGWTTIRKLGYPICMVQSKEFSFKCGWKISYFNYHPYREIVITFKRIELRSLLLFCIIMGMKFGGVENFPKIVSNGKVLIHGYEIDHNWTK